jgi:hypothetical protein
VEYKYSSSGYLIWKVLFHLRWRWRPVNWFWAALFLR